MKKGDLLAKIDVSALKAALDHARTAYKLADDARVTVRIFSLTGRLVLNKEYPSGSTGGLAGLNEISWDGRNGEGETVSSGGYIAVVEAARNGETIHIMRRKIAVVR